MNQRMAFFRFQKLRDIGCSDLQLQRGRHSIERLDSLARQILSVLMEINESGRNH